MLKHSTDAYCKFKTQQILASLLLVTFSLLIFNIRPGVDDGLGLALELSEVIAYCLQMYSHHPIQVI